MPNILKISCPASAKLVSTMKQVSAALRAMRLRRAGSTLCGDRKKRRNRRERIDQKEDGAQRQH